MFKKLIDSYVYNMKKGDVYDFALKNGINLSEDELSYVYDVIKKEYQTIIYGNPDSIFNDLRGKFPLETVMKVEKLYLDFKSRFDDYL